MSKRSTIFILAIVTLLVSIACVLNIGGPDYPQSTIPISTEELSKMQDQIEQAVLEGVLSGDITLFITESQITSYLDSRLAVQENPFISNPQVYLQEGKIMVYGTVTRGYFEATVEVVFTANIDPAGKMILELTSADFGPFNIPDNLKEVITSLVTEAYTGSLGPVATGFRLEGIVISDGIMMIVGKIN
ncbi:hypothetical protein ACFLTX_00920 [Chloroflexota bacterium]